jgi:hypothetical protein
MAIRPEWRKMVDDYNSIAEGLHRAFFLFATDAAKAEGYNVLFRGKFFQGLLEDPSCGTETPFIMARPPGEEGFRGRIFEEGNVAGFDGDMEPGKSVSFEKVYEMGFTSHRLTIHYDSEYDPEKRLYIGGWRLDHKGDMAKEGPFFLEPYVNPDGN